MKGKHELKNVAIRMVEAPPLYSEEQLKTPKDVVRVLGKELETYDREVLCVVNLRNDLAPINMNIVSMGSLKTSIVSAREVFKSSISGRYLDMTVDVEAGEYEEFCIEVAKDGKFKTSIFYNPQENLLTVSRTDAGMESDKITEKSAYVSEQNGKISLRVLIDNCALEVFVNDGEQVMSTLVFTPEKADGICFRSKGKVIFHVAKYGLMAGA